MWPGSAPACPRSSTSRRARSTTSRTSPLGRRSRSKPASRSVIAFPSTSTTTPTVSPRARSTSGRSGPTTTPSGSSSARASGPASSPTGGSIRARTAGPASSACCPTSTGISRLTPAASTSAGSTDRRGGRSRGGPNGGRPAHSAIFAEFGRHLGEAVKAICYAVDPEIVVLGGSVGKSFRFFRAGLETAFATYAYSLAKERLRIEVSETEGIAILGAAALYFDARRG